MKIGRWQVHPDRISSGSIAVASLWLLYVASTEEWAFQATRDGLSVGFFPRIAVAATLGITILMLIFPAKAYPNLLQNMTKKGLLSALIGLTATTAFYLLLIRVGYIFASVPFLFGGMFALGVRPWYMALIYGLAASLFVFGLFYVLGYPLPGMN